MDGVFLQPMHHEVGAVVDDERLPICGGARS